MNLLNIVKFNTKKALFVICIIFYLQASSAIVPLYISETAEASPKLIFATTPQKETINLYKIITNQTSSNTFEHLWQYRFAKNKKIQQMSASIGDITGNGKKELVVLIKGQGFETEIYIFKIDQNIPTPRPEIYSIKNTHKSADALDLVLIKADKDKDFEIAVGFSSPERSVLLFDYAIDKLINTQSIGQKFLLDTWGPIFIKSTKTPTATTEVLNIYSNNKESINTTYLGNELIEETSLKSKKIHNIITHHNQNKKTIIYKDTTLLDGTDPIKGKDIKEAIIINQNTLLITKENEPKIINNKIKNKAKTIKTKFKRPTMKLLSDKQVLFSNLEQEELEIFNLPTSATIELEKNEEVQPVVEEEIIVNGTTVSLIIEENKQQTEQANTIITSNQPPPKEAGLNKNNAEHTTLNHDTIFVNVKEKMFFKIPVNIEKTFLSLKTTLLPSGMSIETDSLMFTWVPTQKNIGFNYLEYTIVYQKNVPITQTSNDGIIELINNVEETEEHSVLPIYVNDVPRLKFNALEDTTIVSKKLNLSWDIQDLNTEQTHTVNLKNINRFNKISLKKNTLEWEPSNKELGPQTLEFVVSDGVAQADQNIKIYVDSLLTKPKILNEFIATVNKEFTYNLGHEEGNTYSITKGPNNLRITKQGTIHWVPIITQVDSNTVEILINNKNQNEESQRYRVYVNSVPVISYRPSLEEEVSQNENFIFQCQSFDFNKEALVQWSINGEGATIDQSVKININTIDQKDNHIYTVTLSDGIDSSAFTGILYINTPPIITSTPPEYIQLGDSLQYIIKVEDDNKERPFDSTQKLELQYTIISAPKNLSVNKAGEVFWIPKSSQLGENKIEINVFDGIENIRHNFSVLVNDAPNIISTDSISIELGDTLVHLFNVEDLDEQTEFFYNIKTSIDELLFNTKEGKLTWIPKENDLGLHTLDVSVSDDYEQSATTQNLKIFVYKKPELLNKPNAEAFVGLDYIYKPKGINMYGDTMLNRAIFIKELSLQSEDSSYFYTKNIINWKPKITEIGNNQIKIDLIDSLGYENKYIFNVNTILSPCETIDTLYLAQDTIRITTIDTLMIEIKDTIHSQVIDSIYLDLKDSTFIKSPPKEKDNKFKIKKLYSPWNN